jgi:hypothetical protein
MKVKNIITVLISISFLFVLSCNDHTVPPQNYDFKYPLKVGSEWKYIYSVRFENVHPDSINHLLNDYSSDYIISITKDTTINSRYMAEWKRTLDPGTVLYEYYANEENGLIKYGYRTDYGTILPKSTGVRYLFEGKYYSDISDLIINFETSHFLARPLSDSIIFYYQPILVYPYPLNVGNQWMDNYYFNMTKKVVGQELISTPAGRYLCYKILWEHLTADESVDENYKVYEYICQKGLVKKVIEIKNISITTVEYPDGIGTADVLEEMSVEDINF